MTDPAVPLPAARSGRAVKIALVASLALNLGFLGLIGGALWHGGPDRAGRFMRDAGLGPFAGALTPEDRRAIGQAFLARIGPPRQVRAEMRADMSGLLQLLRADPFDGAAFDAALSRLAGRSSDRLMLGQQLMAERIAAMLPEARHQFADRLEKAMARGPRNRPPDPPPGD